MLRFLLLMLGLFLAGLYLWRALIRLARGGARRDLPAKERMVPCARCGLYVPEGEALAREALFYCSEEHRLAGPSGDRP